MRRIENSTTGEWITFTRTASETEGQLLEMENRWSRADHRTPMHLHPEMEERWHVVHGRVGFRIGTAEHIAGPGESVIAPAGVAHSAWNAGDGEVLLRIEMRPALRWQEFVERLFAISSADPAGQRREAIGALMAEFSREVVPAGGQA